MTLNAHTLSPFRDRLPELLAPAGNWDCAKAAIENGADAIYFGLERFNARIRAENFTEADLPELMAFLHRRGVKGYVTVNTLVFTEELPEVEQYLRSIIAAGVDAVIVQDVGICRLIRHLSPDFPIHASTQMTITSVAGVEFARNLGCQLVVLARECSIQELNKIQQQLRDRHFTLPLEVFVHGALCVAYSGQCLTSESLGGRSANRGECAQACRMPYELIADGKLVDLGDRKYLLSPQDLAGLEVLPDLIQAGVTCLKIEGRLKSPEYVANVTRVYRQALEQLKSQKVEGNGQELEVRSQKSGDAVGQGDKGGGKDRVNQRKLSSPSRLSIVSRERYQLEMAFSRGLYTGWFKGINNQELVHGRFGKKRGFYLGEVIRIQNDKVMLRLASTFNPQPLTSSPFPLKPGDGVVFDSGHPETEEAGGRIYAVEQRGQDAILTFGRGNVDLRKINVGDCVWKTSDPELDKHLRQSYAGDTPKFQRPIQIEVHGEIGQPLVAIARDELGHVVQVESEMSLMLAEKQPLTTERLQEQFSRLGNTPFRLEQLSNQLQGNVLLPVSELNRLRREIVTQLEKMRSHPKRWQLQSSVSWKDLLPSNDSTGANCQSSPQKPELIVLVRNLAQLQAALQAGVITLYCEFEDPRIYQEAMRMKAEDRYSSSPSPQIFVASPRITKPGENWILKQVRSCNADGYLIRNYDQLQFFRGDRCIGDFSLNVANPLTASYFKQEFGLERLTASYDLNIQQLENLLKHSPQNWFEITIHQHMPMFHMEHCVFCAFLSDGTDYTNCGRPCETHEVKLRDRVGTEHILLADAGCRNTVFNGVPQTGAESVRRLLQLGQRQFRVEFLNESPTQVTKTIQHYRNLLQGTITGTQLWKELKLHSQLGVTRGAIAI
ncbi:collagenase-like protease [Leptolyngbyaceae cyanobacterium JSC-12]|nr:collagenase-like protease [Leptolyngbyaceae cyanobacterium JSC-12]